LANTLIQSTVQDRVRTTLDSFKDQIQKTQVDVQAAEHQIGQVQATISDKTKELVNLETELEQLIAKGNELSTIMQRGLKEYFK
jgi:chromosome segregation ATPase